MYRSPSTYASCTEWAAVPFLLLASAATRRRGKKTSSPPSASLTVQCTLYTNINNTSGNCDYGGEKCCFLIHMCSRHIIYSHSARLPSSGFDEQFRGTCFGDPPKKKNVGFLEIGRKN